MRIVIDMQGAQSGIAPSARTDRGMADARAGGGCEPRKPLEAGTGERLREVFRANLKPDVIYVSSLFEGFVDDAVTAVGALENALPTAITLYDLIRLLYQDIYLTDPVVRSSAITPDLYRSDWALVMWKSQ